MSDTLTQYFRLVTKMRDPETPELTKAIIRDTGLPDLMAKTHHSSLKIRIQKEIDCGFQGNQHAG